MVESKIIRYHLCILKIGAQYWHVQRVTSSAAACIRKLRVVLPMLHTALGNHSRYLQSRGEQSLVLLDTKHRYFFVCKRPPATPPPAPSNLARCTFTAFSIFGWFRRTEGQNLTRFGPTTSERAASRCVRNVALS